MEVASSSTNVIRPALESSGIPWHPISLTREIVARDLRAGGQLRALDRGRPYDVIHAHSSKAGALARTVLPHRRRRIVYTPHGFAFVGSVARVKRALYRGVEQALLPATGAIIAVSAFERSNAIRTLHGATNRFRLIRNGVPPCAEIEADRSLLRFKGDGALAGIISVLRPEKDPLTAVRAGALLAARGALPGRLAIVGNGWLEGEVRAEIERLGVGDHVRWFRFDGPMASYLRALDLLVLPSRWEALPLGPIEAMTCGVPVLATAVGGVPEVVEHGVTGRLFEPGDPDALARELEQLLGNAQLRAKMGEAGRNVAAASFGLDRMVDQTEQVYHELLGRQ